MSTEEFPPVFQRHLTRVEARQAENTLRNRKGTLRQWCAFCERFEEDITDVSPGLVGEWLDHLSNEGYAHRTIRNRGYDLSKTYSDLVGRGLVDEDPTEGVDMSWLKETPKIDEYRSIRYIDLDEWDLLLDAAQDTREVVLFKLLWETGVRAIEASNIAIEHIDRDERAIEVETAKQQSTTLRTVYYGRSLARSLREWLDYGKRNTWYGAGQSDRLLISKQSGVLRTERIADLVREGANRADIQEVVYRDKAGKPRHRVTPHTLRHSYAVHRTKRGMPIVYLQDLMGHSDIDVTRQYLKFREDDLQDAARRYAP